jgi:metal-responsive CopG/Arc/MetJ family transcriptional regulator
MADRGARFQVWDTEEQLEKLDKAIKALGYKDRADWYRDMKRQAIRQGEISIKVEGEGK